VPPEKIVSDFAPEGKPICFCSPIRSNALSDLRVDFEDRKSRHGVRLNEHLEHDCGLTVFQHACQMGLEGIVSERLGSRYRSGRSPDWLKFKNPEAPAVLREAEEDWGKARR
jgi:ATP-dependent DNA ligase